MSAPISLQDALTDYAQILTTLEHSQQEDKVTQPRCALSALVIRDAVQSFLTEASSISADQLLQLSELDDRLIAQKTFIVRALDMPHWRSQLDPPESAWWWHFEPPALLPILEKRHSWLDRLDWLWTFASLFFFTFAVTVVFDTLNRVVGGGLNPEGVFPLMVQVLLTIAGGSAALTKNGREVLRSLMSRLHIPKHFWQEFSAIASLIMLITVLGIQAFYLPHLAFRLHQDGIDHYEAGRFDSALQAYQQALALRPDFIRGRYSLALIYEDLQRIDEAIAEYQSVVNQDPAVLGRLAWLRAHNNLGRLYILGEQYRTAWIPLERAFNSITEDDLTDSEIQAEYYNLLKNLGWLWLAQGQLIEADEYLTQAIDQNSQWSAAHCLKAQVLEGLEETEAAIAAWASCLTGDRRVQAEEAEWAAMAKERLEVIE